MYLPKGTFPRNTAFFWSWSAFLDAMSTLMWWSSKTVPLNTRAFWADSTSTKRMKACMLVLSGWKSRFMTATFFGTLGSARGGQRSLTDSTLPYFSNSFVSFFAVMSCGTLPTKIVRILCSLVTSSFFNRNSFFLLFFRRFTAHTALDVTLSGSAPEASVLFLKS